jgi:hypothetical protein
MPQSCDVHCGQRVALIEIVEAQYGQSFVVGSAAGVGLSIPFKEKTSGRCRPGQSDTGRCLFMFD